MLSSIFLLVMMLVVAMTVFVCSCARRKRNAD